MSREVTNELTILRRQVEALAARLVVLESKSPKRLLSVKEAAQLLGITPGTLRRWVQNEKITFIRVGNHPKFEMSTIDHFCAQRRVRRRPRLLRSRSITHDA